MRDAAGYSLAPRDAAAAASIASATTVTAPFQPHRSITQPVSGGPSSIPTLLHKLKSAVAAVVSLLAENLYMGTPLNSKYDVDTDIRFLVVSKHLIFYRVREPAYVEVARVIDGRQDYMAILF